jgi:hypothetical protein
MTPWLYAGRDEKLAQLKAFTLVEFHKQKGSNNVSSVPGVHFHKTPNQPLCFWQAMITFNNGKRITRPRGGKAKRGKFPPAAGSNGPSQQNFQ